MTRRSDRNRKTGLQKADGVISALLSRRGYAHVQTADELASAWQGVVGAAMAEKTRATQVTAGKLEVVVDNSSVMQELAFQQHVLLKAMQEQLPERTIRGLRFRIGNVT